MNIYYSKSIILFIFLSIPIFSSIKTKQHEVMNQSVLIYQSLSDYAMIGMNMNFLKSKNDLSSRINTFNKNLELIQAYTNDQRLQESMDKFNTSWLHIRKVLTSTPNPQAVKGLISQVNILIEELSPINTIILENTTLKDDEIFIFLEKQRMLSQKIMALYMLSGWKDTSIDLSDVLAESVNSFLLIYSKLENFMSSNKVFNDLLKSIKKSFLFIRMQVTNKQMKFTPSLVMRKSKKILELNEKILSIYLETKEK